MDNLREHLREHLREDLGEDLGENLGEDLRGEIGGRLERGNWGNLRSNTYLSNLIYFCKNMYLNK